MKVLLTICLLLISTPSIATAQESGLQALRFASIAKAGGAPSRVRAQTRESAAPTRTQTREAERLLSDMGYWTGAVDGVFDSVTRAALIAFQKWEGRAITGRLTNDELEAIRISTSPRAREVGYAHVEVDLDRQVMLIVTEGGGTVSPRVGPAIQRTIKSADKAAPSKENSVRVIHVSTGNDRPFMEDGQESIAYTPRGRFLVYDKSIGWEKGYLGSMYYSNYISGGVAIHGHPNVPNVPASHGCIRIPMFAAREVSKLLKLGTIVLVYDNSSFVSGKEWVDNPKLKAAALLESATPDYDYQMKARPRVNRAE